MTTNNDGNSVSQTPEQNPAQTPEQNPEKKRFPDEPWDMPA